MKRRKFVLVAGAVVGAVLHRREVRAQAGWQGYTELGIKAGAERCAIFGKGDTAVKWAGSGPNRGVTTIRNFKQLVADIKAGTASSELHFDGTKFMNTLVSEKGTASQMHIGKAGDYACAVQQTKNTIIICISKGSPQAAVAHIAPVYKAVAGAGQ